MIFDLWWLSYPVLGAVIGVSFGVRAVIPARAGIQRLAPKCWIPAFAGMTSERYYK